MRVHQTLYAQKSVRMVELESCGDCTVPLSAGTLIQFTRSSLHWTFRLGLRAPLRLRQPPIFARGVLQAYLPSVWLRRICNIEKPLRAMSLLQSFRYEGGKIINTRASSPIKNAQISYRLPYSTYELPPFRSGRISFLNHFQSNKGRVKMIPRELM